jgi:hypothetical protein
LLNNEESVRIEAPLFNVFTDRKFDPLLSKRGLQFGAPYASKWISVHVKGCLYRQAADTSLRVLPQTSGHHSLLMKVINCD